MLAFEWETALISKDVRKVYAERRFQAIGYLNVRLFVVVFCFRGPMVRVISLRKANTREVSAYAKA